MCDELNFFFTSKFERQMWVDKSALTLCFQNKDQPFPEAAFLRRISEAPRWQWGLEAKVPKRRSFARKI